jgi:hypothetical protein
MPFAAADVQLKEKAVSNVIIKEFDLPAEYEFTIVNNNDYTDIFTIDSLLDVNITPKDNVLALRNSEKTVTKQIYASPEMREEENGLLSITYYADGETSNLWKSTFFLDFISMNDLVTIEMPPTITKDDTEMTVVLNLTRDVKLDTKLTLVSELLSYSDDVTLTAEGVVLTVPLKQEMPKAGTYEVKATFEVGDSSYTESNNVVLKSEIIVNEKDPVKSGWLLNRKIIYEKENAGNSVTDVTVTVKKSVVSGLFTSFNMGPTSVKRDGSIAAYEFIKELNPGESIQVIAVTSYYLPILILVLLIAAGWIFVVVTTPQVKIMKRAVRVRTRSGAFATKIVLAIKNKGKSEVNSLKVIDRLPPFTEVVPGKFGTISPSEARKSTLIWNIDKLAPQEEMMLSYIVYSKLTIIGKLDVPVTYATYMDAKNRLHEAKSNGLFVIAPEQPPVQSEIFK